MRLTQLKITSISLFGVLILLFVFCSKYTFGNEINNPKYQDPDQYDIVYSAEKDFYNKQYSEAIVKYQKMLKTSSVDSILIFRKLAFGYAKINNAELASEYIEKYVKSSLDVTFVGHSYFDPISGSNKYQELSDKYLKKIDLWSLFCLYVGFIGVFIAIVLNFKKRSDKLANLLMSAFVLQHSFFIIHISLLLTNLEYYLPHTLYGSTVFSFLYGPLIYFYFKRVTKKYKFKILDILHLVPTFLFLLILLPIYVLPAEEKLRMMLNNERPYMALISISKLISLLIYGVFVIKMYFRSIKNNRYISKVQYNWQRNVVIFCSVYIVTYAVYSVLIIQYIISGFLFHMQVASMALLVLYVSYTAFVRPSVFGSLIVVRDKDDLDTSLLTEASLNKYKKSGLTESLSLELKVKLLYLLNDKQIYKQNDLTLQRLAELLDTTRHNASQVINEHFNLNFFELINTYRIQEAKMILKNENNRKLNIIDVAYEVGFNNKATFNKSFKKYNHITPSEYVKSLVA